MDFKTKLRNPKVQQYMLEVIFPLAGYFFWDWSLLIIIAFYLLDYLASQLLFFRRLYFIQKHQNNFYWWLLPLSVSVFTILYLGVLRIMFSSVLLMNINNGIKPYDELILFAKDELWFLFPVIILTYYMMDKMFFYMPRRFMNYKPKSYLVKKLISNTIATFLIIIGAIIVDQYQINDVIIIFSIIITKLIFDFLVKKRLLKIEY